MRYVVNSGFIFRYKTGEIGVLMSRTKLSKHILHAQRHRNEIRRGWTVERFREIQSSLPFWTEVLVFGPFLWPN